MTHKADRFWEQLVAQNPKLKKPNWMLGDLQLNPNLWQQQQLKLLSPSETHHHLPCDVWQVVVVRSIVQGQRGVSLYCCCKAFQETILWLHLWPSICQNPDLCDSTKQRMLYSPLRWQSFKFCCKAIQVGLPACLPSQHQWSVLELLASEQWWCLGSRALE